MRCATLTLVSLVMLGCPAVEPLEEDAAAIAPQIQRIFDESCTEAGCHGRGTAQANLNLEPAQAPGILTNNASQNPSLLLVERGNVDRSYLAIKVLPDHPDRVGQVMPPPGFPMSDQDRAVLLGWIAGAPLAGEDTGLETDTEGEPEMRSCALEDIKPEASSPIDAGTSAEQIPPDIADALERNCGCHYADPPYERPLGGYTGQLDIATWAGFHEEHAFVLCESDLAYVCVAERLDHASLPMPPDQCEVDDGSNITAEDLELLQAWLAADAPDGATWTPQ